jgi:hypothetical protein
MKPASPVSVAVVIPVYKEHLSDYERISLTQCQRILGHYPIALVTPQLLNVSVYKEICPNLQVLSFDSSYFNSIQSYNKLMVSAEFYQAFTEFEYILIYQLDAFVFQDDLADWCHRGYDYIGAPWLRDRDSTGMLDELWFNVKKKLATLAGLKKEDGVTPREIISLNSVGNGGLSLRRVSSMLRYLPRYQQKIAQYEQFQQDQYNEDIFWSIELNRYWPNLRIPSYRKALHFAIEFYPQWAVEHYNNGKLPFGCHAWDIHGTAYWRPIFARYGYQI